jgi:hypothetical protein
MKQLYVAFQTDKVNNGACCWIRREVKKTTAKLQHICVKWAL